MFAFMKRTGRETVEGAQPVTLTVAETMAVAGGTIHKNDTTVGPAPTTSTPAQLEQGRPSTTNKVTLKRAWPLLSGHALFVWSA